MQSQRATLGTRCPLSSGLMSNPLAQHQGTWSPIWLLPPVWPISPHLVPSLALHLAPPYLTLVSTWGWTRWGARQGCKMGVRARWGYSGGIEGQTGGQTWGQRGGTSSKPNEEYPIPARRHSPGMTCERSGSKPLEWIWGQSPGYPQKGQMTSSWKYYGSTWWVTNWCLGKQYLPIILHMWAVIKLEKLIISNHHPGTVWHETKLMSHQSGILYSLIL